MRNHLKLRAFVPTGGHPVRGEPEWQWIGEGYNCQKTIIWELAISLQHLATFEKAWTPTCIHPSGSGESAMCIYSPAEAFQNQFLEAMFINEGSGVYDVKKAVV